MNHRTLLNLSIVLVLLFGMITAAAAIESHPGWVNSLKPTGAPGPELTLAVDGATDYVILVPSAPTTLDDYAAKELSTYLKKMTGAEFPIVREGAEKAGAKVISIGKTQRLASASVPQAKADLAAEGIAIGVKDSDLFLFGGWKRGAIYAVYSLLEEDLGCRWFPDGQDRIPKNPTLKFRPVPRTYVPPLELRDPFYSSALTNDLSMRNKTVGRILELPKELGGYIKSVPNNAHTYDYYVPPDKYFKDHPEYFSMDEKGKRNPAQLCLTNPDVLAITIKEALRFLDENPDASVLEVSPNDRRGWCECDNCKALDAAQKCDDDYGYAYPNRSGTLYTFVNKVAEAIADKHPNVCVSTLAYLGTLRPPKNLKLRPNVRIWLCTTMSWGTISRYITESKNQAKVIDDWNKIGGQLIVWYYPNRYGPGFSELHLNVPVVSEDIRWLTRHGARGIYLQALDTYTTGMDREYLRCWLYAKQLWNPSLDTAKLVRDFNYSFYGPAGEAIQAHDEFLEDKWKQLHMTPAYQVATDCTAVYDPDFLDRALSHLDKAEQIAGDDAALRTLIRMRKVPIWVAKAKMGPVDGLGSYRKMLEEMDNFIRKESGVAYFDYCGRASVTDIAFWRQVADFKPEDIASVEVGVGDQSWRYRPDPKRVGEMEKWFSPDADGRRWQSVTTSTDLSSLDGPAWFRCRFTVPEDFSTRENLWMMFNSDNRLSPDADFTVYIDGKLMKEQTAKAKKRPLLPLDFPFRVGLKGIVKPGSTHSLVVKIDYAGPRPGRKFYPVTLVNSSLEPVGADEGGLIVFDGTIRARAR